MFHLSRALAFIACFAASIFVAWWIGLIGLVAAMIVIPNPQRRVK